MNERTFHLIRVDRSVNVREMLRRAQDAGLDVDDTYFEPETVFMCEAQHATGPVQAEITLFRARTRGGLTRPDDILTDLRAAGLRTSDLFEYVALLRGRPDLFTDAQRQLPHRVMGDPMRLPQTSSAQCVPCVPGLGLPLMLSLDAHANFVGPCIVPAVKL